MAKHRGFVGGPSWPPHMSITGTPAEVTAASLVADEDAIIFIGNVESEDGQSHDYNHIFARNLTSSLIGTLRAGFADVDTAAGPPGRHDGTLDQFGSVTDPASNTTHDFTLSGARTIPHGGLIAVVVKIETFGSGSINIAGMAGGTNAGRPQVTSALTGGTVFANVNSTIPLITLYDSVADRYAVLRGAFPVNSGNTNTATFNNASGVRRAGVGFTVGAPVWGLRGSVLVTNTAGGTFEVRLYEGNTLIASEEFSFRHWGVDAQSRYYAFNFPDAALTAGNDYRVVVVPTTANNVSVFSIPSTAARWRPLTNSGGGGSMGYVTHDGASWSALDTDTLPIIKLELVAVDAGGFPPFGRQSGSH